ncbi:UNVERIFIED_CONTAM: hypothetical protein GTU68_036292 [Idotea baltica]|nr:hypothetical protein [Idotea baltica]
MDWSIIIFLVVIVGIVLYVIGIYNKLVSLKNRFENAFAQIEVQLKRRYDLIPNLVETARGYIQHERETLEAVTAAKSNPGSASAIQDLAGAESALASSMGKFNLVVEAYPDLKANENMMQLSEELTSTENKVAFSRQAFNDSVTAYNEYRQSFPPIFFASAFGHPTDANLLIMEDSAEIQAAPKVSF